MAVSKFRATVFGHIEYKLEAFRIYVCALGKSA
jgi:hypothetical protein